jgi:hypothetical protein
MKIWKSEKHQQSVPDGHASNTSVTCTKTALKVWERGYGERKFKLHEFELREIPDYTGKQPVLLGTEDENREWLQYAREHGWYVAAQFLDCCDMVKYSHGKAMFDTNKWRPKAEDVAEFERRTKLRFYDFADYLVYTFGGSVTLDPLALEKWLVRNTEYKQDWDVSIHDYCDTFWGAGTGDLVSRLMHNPDEQSIPAGTASN